MVQLHRIPTHYRYIQNHFKRDSTLKMSTRQEDNTPIMK
jgi:hypothetical protein